MKPHTTLDKITACNPCQSGLENLLRIIGRNYPIDKPIYFIDMLDRVPIQDTIWAFRAAPEYVATWVKFAQECAALAKRRATEAAYAAAEAADAAYAAEAAYAAARNEQKEMLRKLLTEAA